MIKIETFRKIATDSKDVDTLYALLNHFQTHKGFRHDYKQNQLIKVLHKQLGFGNLNTSCGSCLSTGMNKIITYCNNFIVETDYTVTPKITTKKVKRKAKQIDIEESIEEIESEIPSNYMALKKYAETKLGKKYAKGTKKKTILKDLGVE
jgi:hypothetical protein